MRPFTTITLHSLYFVRASFANKQNSTAEFRGLGAQCVCVGMWGLSCVRL
jgi:hypothetical protein